MASALIVRIQFNRPESNDLIEFKNGVSLVMLGLLRNSFAESESSLWKGYLRPSIVNQVQSTTVVTETKNHSDK